MLEHGRFLLSRWLFSPLSGLTPGEWRRVLAENRYRISPRYLPRALWTSVQSLVNGVEARREERRFREAIEAATVERPVFVLGHYRSGTTYLHNLLDADPRHATTDNLNATYARTFLSSGEAKRRWGRHLTMRRRPQDEVRLDLSVPAEDELALCALTRLSPHMAWHFPHRAERYRRTLTLRECSEEERARWRAGLDLFLRKLAVAHPGRTLVLKSPCHTARVRTILEVFPDARFVHVARDPWEVYASTMKMERTVPPHFEFQRRDPEAVEEDVLWRLEAMYAAYLEDREHVPPGQLAEVRYEELVSDPLAVLGRVYRELDLGELEDARPEIEAYLKGVRDYRRNRYDRLPEEIRARIARRWRAYLDAFGYSSD